MLPLPLGTHLVNRPLPPAVWFGRAWPGAPALLVPQLQRTSVALDGMVAQARTVDA